MSNFKIRHVLLHLMPLAALITPLPTKLIKIKMSFGRLFKYFMGRKKLNRTIMISRVDTQTPETIKEIAQVLGYISIRLVLRIIVGWVERSVTQPKCDWYSFF